MRWADGAATSRSASYTLRRVIKRPLTVVMLLTGLNLLNYLDRWLIAAVSPNIQRELGLSDAQTGGVGSAFLWGYLLFSPLVALLGERVRRTWLIGAGVALWCLATAGSGLAATFATLIAMRVAVGIGEASYASLSPTLIDEISPAAKKARTLAIFYAAIPVGSALGFVVGGALDAAIGWRAAFYVAGGPGVLLALSCFFIADAPPKPRERRAGLVEALRGTLRSPRYVWLVAGFIAQTFALGGFGFWAPHFLERTFHMELSKANTTLGGILVVTGLAGAILGGVVADRSRDHDRVRAQVRVCAVTAALAVPFAAWAVLAGSPVAFFVALGLAELFIFSSTAPFNAALMASVPFGLRAMAMAFSIFAGHLLGDIISEPLVGELSDRLGSLRPAMYVLAAAVVVNALAWGAALRARQVVDEPAS